LDITTFVILLIIFFLLTRTRTEEVLPSPIPWEVRVFLDRIKPYEDYIQAEAKINTIDPNLIRALIWQESSGKVDVKTYEGKPDWYNGKSLYSYGLCGLTLPAAEDMGYTGKEEDLIKPDINIKYAVKYLRHQINRYDGDVSKGLVAYNAGHWTGNYSYANLIWKKMKKIQDALASKYKEV